MFVDRSEGTVQPILDSLSTEQHAQNMTLADFPKLKRLPAKQKLKLAEELWFEGVSDETLAVPAWHKEILSERMAAYKRGALKTISMDELKRRLRLK